MNSNGVRVIRDYTLFPLERKRKMLSFFDSVHNFTLRVYEYMSQI